MNKLLLLFVFTLSGCALQHQHLGPLTETPNLTETAYHAADGRVLPVSTWRPEGEPKAVILALHGFNDYRMAYDLPGQYFAENGILTFAFDQRGFGENEKAGIWAEKEALKNDVLEMLALIRAKYPGKPLFLMGESMGGAIALYALSGREDAADGLILTAPAVWGWRPVNIVYRPSLWLAAHIISGKKFSGKNLDLVPSDNIGALRAMAKDPYVIKKTRLDAIYGLSRMMKWGMKSASEIEVPALLLYGREEHLVPDKNLLKLWEKLPADLKSREVFEDGYHLLLRDCGAGQVWQSIVRFIAANSGLQIELKPVEASLCEAQ